MKKYFKYAFVKVFTIVAPIAIALFIAATVVLTGVLPGLMDVMFGGDRAVKSGVTGSNEYYTKDEGITDKASALANANAVNEEICGEGFVLFKNDGVLPVKTSSSNKVKVSVYGKNSVSLAYGSSGSVGGNVSNPKTIFDSLTAANFQYNTVLKAFYEDNDASGPARPANPDLSGAIPTGFATGETPVARYTDAVKNSLKEYNGLALVVITRVSGENSDLPTTMRDKSGGAVTGAMSEDDHYLELDQNEQEMLKLACENSDNVVLIINTGTPVELGFLDSVADGDSTSINYDFATKVKGAIQIGLPGASGIMALGRILNGEVNPSGKTVDTYARDFMKIPAVENFSVKGISGLDGYTVNGRAQEQYFIDYEEGIYVGYRYFETRGETDGEEWYKQNVVYPFGYGLSYTTFKKTVRQTNIKESATWKAGDELSITVEVENTGSVAGKDVVELFVKQPYKGGVEKSAEVLVAFAKTKLIEPGAKDEVTLTFTPYDFASYDYADKNSDGHKGYEIEAGDYEFAICSDAHTVEATVNCKLTSGIKIEEDISSGYEVKNRFENADDQLGSILSRANWTGTYPAMRTDREKEADTAFINNLRGDRDSGNPLTANSAEVKDAAVNRAPAKSKSDEGLQLYELRTLEANDKMWDKLLQRITASSLWDLLSSAAFKTPAINYIGKPLTIDTDGPAGFTKFMGDTGQISETCVYCCEPVLAATWNVELAEKMGNAVGNEGLVGWVNGKMTYSGWYAPGVNLHRTPFGGRNPEYYSEDAALTGYIASAVIRGAADKGVYAFVKHFAVNDQETHRGGVCTWVDEQALRELYLKPFELTVKVGKATALMSSFNRVGAKWTGGDYRLLTEVLRNEWGFNGMVICDFASNQAHMNMEQMVYAGGDLWLDTITPNGWYDKNDALDVYVMQEAAKHVLYTVANSNAMNGMGEGVIYTMNMAYWRIALIIIDVVAFAGIAVWGVLVALKTVKKVKQDGNN